MIVNAFDEICSLTSKIQSNSLMLWICIYQDFMEMKEIELYYIKVSWSQEIRLFGYKLLR